MPDRLPWIGDLEPEEAARAVMAPRRKRTWGDPNPKRLTPMVRATIVTAIIRGMHRAQAAALAGISPSTLEKWLEAGQSSTAIPGDAAYDLYVMVEGAEAASEYRLVQRIEKASETDWRAAESLLKRRFPDRWGDRSRVDLAVLLAEVRKWTADFPELTEEEIMEAAQRFLGSGR